MLVSALYIHKCWGRSKQFCYIFGGLPVLLLSRCWLKDSTQDMSAWLFLQYPGWSVTLNRTLIGVHCFCPDVDECRTVPGVCQNGRCYNTQGGYRCDCNPGYETSEDGKACFGESLICVCRRVYGRPPGCPPPHPHPQPPFYPSLSFTISRSSSSVGTADMSVLYLHHWKMKFNHAVSLCSSLFPVPSPFASPPTPTPLFPYKNILHFFLLTEICKVTSVLMQE